MTVERIREAHRDNNISFSHHSVGVLLDEIDRLKQEIHDRGNQAQELIADEVVAAEATFRKRCETGQNCPPRAQLKEKFGI